MVISTLAKSRLPWLDARRAGTLAAVCVATAAPLGHAHSQVTPVPSRPPGGPDLLPPSTAEGLPTAVALRRIAEAVDGHRTGKRVWVVLQLRDALGATAVVESRESADSVVRAAREPGLAVYGPFATVVDVPGQPSSSIVLPSLALDPGGCVHRHSAMHRGSICPPELPKDLVKLTVTLERTGGRRQTFTLPTDADALFFGMSAIDKFVIPYYTHVLGVQGAAAMRQSILSGVR